MKAPSKRLAQQTIAMVVIAAMLAAVGLSPILILFFFLTGFLIWVVVARSNRREAQEVFAFYIAADEILRDEERRWYGFEITEVVHRGERVLDWMPDPPPLIYFSLGALQHHAGNYEAAVENLAAVVETDFREEHQASSPSPALRRYVQLLRSIEREPAIAPLALGAVRSLERGRRARAALLLAESRERLQELALSAELAGESGVNELSPQAGFPNRTSLDSVMVPRPISEVLHDVYQDERIS